MKPQEFLALVVLSYVALAGMFQLSLMQSLATATGYAASDIFGFIAAILLFFYVLIGVFVLRT